jgi:hypothetical protein
MNVIVMLMRMSVTVMIMLMAVFVDLLVGAFVRGVLIDGTVERMSAAHGENVLRFPQSARNVVRHHHDRAAALFVEHPDGVVHFVCGFRIETVDRLVEKDQRIGRTHRPGKQNALPLTTGQFAERFVRESVDS